MAHKLLTAKGFTFLQSGIIHTSLRKCMFVPWKKVSYIELRTRPDGSPDDYLGVQHGDCFESRLEVPISTTDCDSFNTNNDEVYSVVKDKYKEYCMSLPCEGNIQNDEQDQDKHSATPDEIRKNGELLATIRPGVW